MKPHVNSPLDERGFTMIELIVSMAIFTMLGTMAVFLMRQGLHIFEQGTREAALYNRLDTVLPIVEQDLHGLRVVIDTDAPALPDARPVGPNRDAGVALPPPPVSIRLRSTHIVLKSALPESDGRYGFPAPYFAFVADVSEGVDPLYGALDMAGGPEALVVTPATVEARGPESVFQPIGGLVEICYVAIPERADFPSILTLYRGYRAPIGDPEESLLLPQNLDTIEKIKQRCRPVATGLLHFGVTWRRIFATSWEPQTARRGTGGELTRYVGPDWDSTRGADKRFALFVGPESLVDPSDDIFPAFVRLDVALASPTSFGYGRGDGKLVNGVGKDDRKLRVSDLDVLLKPGLGRNRYMKIGIEWIRYQPTDVDYAKGTVRVERGVRGTKAVAHPGDDWFYLGLPAAAELKLPVYKDRFTLPREGAPR